MILNERRYSAACFLRSHRRSTDGFTLIELLVVVAIIAVLVAMLLPALARAREMARKTTCLTNMKQIGVGLVMYFQEYNEIPVSHSAVLTWWRSNGISFKPLLDGRYIDTPQLLFCPSDTNHRLDLTGECSNTGYCTYLYLRPAYMRSSQYITVTVFEYPPRWFELFASPTPYGGYAYRNAHQDGFTALANDGTVGWIPDHPKSDLALWDWARIDRKLGVPGCNNRL